MLIPLDPTDHEDPLVQFLVDLGVVMTFTLLFLGATWLACEWAFPR